jgi:hypothetical protein
MALMVKAISYARAEGTSRTALAKYLHQKARLLDADVIGQTSDWTT